MTSLRIIITTLPIILGARTLWTSESMAEGERMGTMHIAKREQQL
jgi:hypothetical protein